MWIDSESLLLSTATYLPSPNCNERPQETEINLLVVHGISLPPGEFGGDGITQLFHNIINPDEHPYYKEIAELKVSAHLLIRRDGSMIQYVPFDKRAWHAGVSSFQGVEECNDYSIGIELEGADDIPYEDKQYKKLAEVAQLLMKCYPSINLGRIVGHSDIAPGRKTDPGATFNWTYFYGLVEKDYQR